MCTLFIYIYIYRFIMQVLRGHSNMSECVRKNFSQAEKFFLCQTSKKRCQCDKTTKKNLSEAEQFFLTVPHSKGKQIASPRRK